MAFVVTLIFVLFQLQPNCVKEKASTCLIHQQQWGRMEELSPSWRRKLNIGVCQEGALALPLEGTWGEGDRNFSHLTTETPFLPLVPEFRAVYNLCLASWWFQWPLDMVFLRVLSYKGLSFV